MTKVRELTHKEFTEKKVTKIKFIKDCSGNEFTEKNVTAPEFWECIDLICLNWRESGFDLMRCYDEGENNGVLVLGHFNDGIV